MPKEDLNEQDSYVNWVHMEVVATMKHFTSWGRKRGGGISKLMLKKKVMRYDFVCLYKILVLAKVCDL